MATISILALIPGPIIAQLLTEKNTRPLTIGARAAAMAHAYTADVHDMAVLYANPASLSFLEKHSVMIDHFYEHATAVNNDVVAFPLSLGRQNTIGIGLMASHIGVIVGNPSYPGRTIQYGFDVAYAKILTTGLSAGLRVGARISQGGTARLATSTWTLGINYYPTPEISYGVVFGEFGEGVRVVEQTLERHRLSRRLQMGITMRYPALRKHRIVSVALTNEKIFGEAGLYYKAGFEISPWELVAARVGYIVAPSHSGALYGAGIRTDYFQFDYAISPNTRFFRFQQLSLSILIQ